MIFKRYDDIDYSRFKCSILARFIIWWISDNTLSPLRRISAWSRHLPLSQCSRCRRDVGHFQLLLQYCAGFHDLGLSSLISVIYDIDIEPLPFPFFISDSLPPRIMLRIIHTPRAHLYFETTWGQCRPLLERFLSSPSCFPPSRRYLRFRSTVISLCDFDYRARRLHQQMHYFNEKYSLASSELHIISVSGAIYCADRWYLLNIWYRFFAKGLASSVFCDTSSHTVEWMRRIGFAHSLVLG